MVPRANKNSEMNELKVSCIEKILIQAQKPLLEVA